MKLSAAQLRAIARAMSPEWCLAPDDFEGVSLQTLRALKRKGWLAPDDPADLEGEWSMTDAGWEAFASPPSRRPRSAFKAVEAALVALVGSAAGLYRPKDLGRNWYSSDDEPRDFSEAIAVLDLTELVEAGRFASHLEEADMEVLTQLCEGAGELACRWGHELEASGAELPGGGFVAYWPA